jgi:hypothetical protein
VDRFQRGSVSSSSRASIFEIGARALSLESFRKATDFAQLSKKEYLLIVITGQSAHLYWRKQPRLGEGMHNLEES